jgi:hypothetical protein
MKEGGFSALLCDFGHHKFDTWKYTNEKDCRKRLAAFAENFSQILPRAKLNLGTKISE